LEIQNINVHYTSTSGLSLLCFEQITDIHKVSLKLRILLGKKDYRCSPGIINREDTFGEKDYKCLPDINIWSFIALFVQIIDVHQVSSTLRILLERKNYRCSPHKMNIEDAFGKKIKNFRSRRWGSSLTGLRTRDPPLSPPST
jgi:hypothetical protein